MDFNLTSKALEFPLRTKWVIVKYDVSLNIVHDIKELY